MYPWAKERERDDILNSKCHINATFSQTRPVMKCIRMYTIWFSWFSELSIVCSIQMLTLRGESQHCNLSHFPYNFRSTELKQQRMSLSFNWDCTIATLIQATNCMMIIPSTWTLHVNETARQIKVLLRVSGNLWGAFLFHLIRGLCDSNIIITKLQRQGCSGGEGWGNGDVHFFPLTCLTAFHCSVTY